jgi:hypothetical protein
MVSQRVMPELGTMRERETPPPRPPRVFLLSPARLDGARGLRLRGPPGRLADAERAIGEGLRSAAGVALEDLFAKISGLYFRGKLAYARRFARPSPGAPGVHLITTDRGLVREGTRVRIADVEAMAAGEVDARRDGYRVPLRGSARRLLAASGPDTEFVLLGSVATDKYRVPLGAILGERLMVPHAIVGRGTLERGSLLLRAARDGRELSCAPVPVADALRSRARGRDVHGRQREPREREEAKETRR